MEKIRAVYRMPAKQLKENPEAVTRVGYELFQHIAILMQKENIIEVVQAEGVIDDQVEFQLGCVVMTIDEWKNLGTKIRKIITAKTSGEIHELATEINDAFLSVKR